MRTRVRPYPLEVMGLGDSLSDIQIGERLNTTKLQ